jgi:Na+-translocating ferredoxin:NAD+ oxidoreductase RnfG subunit
MIKKLLLLLLILTTPLAAKELSERVYLTQEEALNVAFPKSTSIKESQLKLSEQDKAAIEAAMGMKLKQNNYTVFKGYKNDNFLGTAYILDQLGKYYPITMMIHVLPDHSVGNVRIMIYRERIGAEVRKNRFLKQFRRKTLANKLLVDRDIDGITGATISSWSVATAVKKALHLSHLVQDEKMASR